MGRILELAAHLKALLDHDPAEAVQQARMIDLSVPERLASMSLRAAILIDGGALTQQRDAVEEGVTLFRELHELYRTADFAYNLANGLVAWAGVPPQGPDWLDHQERTRERRAEARRYLWMVTQDATADAPLRTQAWTNLANQFSSSSRLGEAQDAWRSALEVDPENGVAAGSAARNLLWLYGQGGCSELTYIEAGLLAKIAERHFERVAQYAGARAAAELAAFARTLEDPPARSAHEDPFIHWVESERLTLAPSAGLVEPTLGKLDWLVLPGILEREPGVSGSPPPIFAMFNVLKGDYILARDLAWKAGQENAWPDTGRYGDTLDFANYGPGASALVLAHRTALDLLDKIAVTANYYFELGHAPSKIYFSRLWRGKSDKAASLQPLAAGVEHAIRRGVHALYGLVELAEDYEGNDGILRPQKDLRNAGTHRFVVLHDLGDLTRCRPALEIERHERESFDQEVLRALRVARAAIQMLVLSIAQNELSLARQDDSPRGVRAPVKLIRRTDLL